MEEWKKIKISDICNRITSGGTPKSTIAEYYGGNIPWLNTKEINFNRIFKTEKSITDLGLKSSSAKLITINSVVVAMYGATAGKVAITKIPLTTNQACCNLSIDSTKADYRYVYYALSNDYSRLASLANGGAQQNLNAQLIKDFEIIYPSLEKQKRIANILSSLDDKIELNNRINANLEEQAQALFHRWFVDFEFPNEQGLPYKSNGGTFVDSELGEIPKGWNVRKLSDISRYNNDRINTNELNIGNYISTENMLPNKNGITRASNIPLNTNVTNYKEGDILLSNIRPYFKKIWISSKTGGCSNDVLNFRTKKVIIPFVYNLIFQDIFFDYIMTGANGSKMPRGNKAHIMSYKFAMPSTMCLIIKYCELINPFIQKIKQMENENDDLSQLRDTILPRLMNNQIKI